MAYEMVSPPQKGSQHAGVTAISPDGNRVFIAGGGFPGTPSTGGFGNMYASSRNGARWTTEPLNLPASEYDNLGFLRDRTRDLSRVLVEGSTIEQADANTVGFYLRGWNGSLSPASPPLTAPAASSLQFATYQAAVPDLSSYVITTSNVSILPGYDPVGQASSLNIYEVTDALTGSPQIRRVDLDNAGQVVGALCSTRRVGGSGRTANAISADGSKIFFSAYSTVPPWTGCLGKGPLRVLARIGGSTTVEVSESQCNRTADPMATPPVPACNAASDVRFEGASADGSRVLLSTVQQLTNDDTDTASDLYMYRFASGDDPATLTRMSAAVTGAPDGVATVQGVVALSEDTSQLYFVARGRLTVDPNARDEQPAPNANNLYLLERTSIHPAGRLTFVATLAAGDSGLWGLSRSARFPFENERVLVFPSSAKLTADDSDAAVDIFRYDADMATMERVSRASEGFGTDGNDPIAAAMGGGASPTGMAGPPTSAVDATGDSILFITKEALDPGDVNGLEDIYLWKDGRVNRVTDGRGANPGVVTNNGSFGISDDGNSVVFSTANQLVAQDRDGANDVYVARVGGGVLTVTPPDSSCMGDLCQGETVPPVLPAIASIAFAGDGNVPSVPGGRKASVRVSKLRSVTGSAAVLKVRVPGAGRISVTGSRIRRVVVRASKAGAYSAGLKLKPGANRSLEGKGTLKVNVRISFRAKRGQKASKAIRVTFKQPNLRRGNAKKGGR